MEEIFRLVLTTIFSEYGLIGGSFFLLLLYVMRENSLREGKYQSVIKKNQDIILEQAKNFEILKDVKSDINDMKIAIELNKRR